MTFIDDCIRFCYVYLMHSKDEVLEEFKIFKIEVELQCETFNQCLRTYGGREYYDPNFLNMLV